MTVLAMRFASTMQSGTSTARWRARFSTSLPGVCSTIWPIDATRCEPPLVTQVGYEARDHIADSHALGTRREGQRHAVLQDGFRECMHIVDRGGKAAFVERRARAQSISAWPARGPGPQATFLSVDALPWPGRAERTSERMASTTVSETGIWRISFWISTSRSLDITALATVADTRGFQQDLTLGGDFRIENVDLQQETVELGFGQRIGAFLLERVLGREHMEGAGSW